MLDPKQIRNVAIVAHDGAGKTALTEALLRHDAPARASKDGSTSHLDAEPEEAKRNFTVATHITYARRQDGKFGGYIEEDIPEQLAADAKKLRTRLVEAVAETDDVLLEKYLDGQEPGEEQIREAIAHAVLGRRFLPVLACAARPGIGVRDLATAMVRYLPDPTSRREIRGKDPHGKEIVRAARVDQAPTLLAFRNTVDHFVGRLTACRIFSGQVKTGQKLYNPRTNQEEILAHIYRIDGNHTAEIPQAAAGEIIGLMKLRDVHVGDTLTAADAPPMRLEVIGKPQRVISYALKIDREQEEKAGVALHKLLEEDPSLELTRDPETNETLLRGMGQVHIEVAVEKLKRKFDVDVHLELPHPAYHETILTRAKAQGKYKRQSGGRGQYGDCHIELEPLPRGTGVEFEDAIVGGVIPRQFIPSVEHGIRDAAKEGPLGGFPLVDFRVRLVDGSFHTVDSSDMAFRIAGSMALKNALAGAKPVLLEPMMRLEVVVPDEMLGEVIADLTSRRGKIFGMEPTSKGTLIHAQAPHAELRTYAPELRSLTKGMGYFTMEFDRYDEVPTHEAHKVLEQRRAEQGKGEPVPNHPKGRA